MIKVVSIQIFRSQGSEFKSHYMTIFEQVTIQQGYYGSQTGNNVCLSAQWLVYGKQYNSKDNPYFCCQKKKKQ